MLETERLTLRAWAETDAESLYSYAKDPDIGPIAGWPAHRSKEESLNTIRHVLNGKECYAICERGSNNPIGSIELKLNGHTDMTDRDDECELGYWLGKPFWGRGYMPEAAKEVIRHGFVDLGMSAIWCGYYDGNLKSKRVQEKVGFVYHHTCDGGTGASYARGACRARECSYQITLAKFSCLLIVLEANLECFGRVLVGFERMLVKTL